MPTTELTYRIEEDGDGLAAFVDLKHVGPIRVGEAHKAGKRWSLSTWDDRTGNSVLFAETRQDALAALDFHASMVARLLSVPAVTA